MKVLITGTSQGIGKAIAELFIQKGHKVVGIDRQEASLVSDSYTHLQCDVRGEMPEVSDVEVLINAVTPDPSSRSTVQAKVE